MTAFLALSALAIIGLALMIGNRFIEPCMLRAVYRRLPQDYVPADQLAESLLIELRNDLITGMLFRLRCRDHIPILMMLDTLHAYGFAECDIRPDRKIEQTKHDLLVKIGRLADSHSDKTLPIRKIENAIKTLSAPQMNWRKHSTRNHEPGLLEFLPT